MIFLLTVGKKAVECSTMKVTIDITEHEAAAQLAAQLGSKVDDVFPEVQDVRVNINRDGAPEPSAEQIRNAMKYCVNVHPGNRVVDKIRTIKQVRELTGYGLADAKFFVEAIWSGF